MRPFTAILGFIAGSLVSMAFGLAVVLTVFWVLQDDHPRFAAELPEVARAFGMFFVTAVFSGFSFIGTVRQQRWRYASLGLMWSAVMLIAVYYWPN